MKRAFLILLFAGLLASVAASPAAALPTCGSPSGSTALLAFINNDCFDLSGAISSGSGVQSHIDTTLSNGAGSIHIFGTLDADPFITFGATTTNIVQGPVTYAFLFGTPIVPDFYNHASSSAGLTVTASEVDATVESSPIYPTYVSGYGTLGLAATNLGVDIGTTTCSATAAQGTTTCFYGPGNSTFAPTLYDNLEALLTYNQTGLLTVASWSGRITLDFVETVPEPASMTLLGAGVVGVTLFQRLRRRS
jgi:hypothetical protein